MLTPNLPVSLLPWLLVALVAGGLVGTALATLLGQQVARRRRAEHAAEQAEADLLPLAQALGHAVEAVIVTGADRRITWVNAAFETITGYRAQEAIGRRPAELLQCEATDPDTIAAMRAALDAGQPFVGEVVNRGRRPEPYWLHLQIHPLRAPDGRLTGFVAIESDITERKRQEAALRDSAALLARTERIAGVGGWTYDAAERRLRCTGHVARLLGLPDDARIGVRDGLRRLAPPERRLVRRLIAAAKGRASPQGADMPITTPAGEQRWLHLTVEIAAGAPGQRITGSLLDVTQRHEMKAELRRSADLLRSAIDAIDEAFALYDTDDRLVFCNERYRQVYAVSREVLVPGMRFEDILRHGAERGLYPAAIGRVDEWVEQRMAAHRLGDRALIQQLADGHILRVIDRKTSDGGTVGFRIDITELVRATEAAEQADHAKSEFIATISHELRTPLQVINGFSDLGRHFAQGHPQFHPMFEDIHAAGSRMLRLVNGLLDISKIDGSVGSMMLRRQPLEPLVDAVAQELAPLAAERGVGFDCALPEALHGDVDAFRFQQVLRNVMANAIRHAPPGSAIEVGGHDLGLDGVEITVRDHGPGVPTEELETIFKPFVQSSRTRDGAGGTGLGLAICRRILGAHGGRIVAELPEGGGALFRTWLPPASPAPPAPLAPADAGESPAPAAPRVRLSALRAASRAAEATVQPTPEEPACHAPS